MKKLINSNYLDDNFNGEYILNQHDKNINDIEKALDIARKFIIDNKCIMVGGMAIDYVLKLKGDGIYNDKKISDYDFLSTDHYDDAKKLMKILIDEGFEEISCVTAVHVQTVRVKYMLYSVADITFVPQNIHKNLKYIMYNDIRVIHPYIQKVDQHRSFAYPFENPPLEVFAGRWKKDIDRFILLDKHYPVIGNTDIKPLKRQKYFDIPLHILDNSVLLSYAAISFYDGNMEIKNIDGGGKIKRNTKSQIKDIYKKSLNIKNENRDTNIDYLHIKSMYNNLLEIGEAYNFKDKVNSIYNHLAKYFNKLKIKLVNPYLDKLPYAISIMNEKDELVRIYNFENSEIRAFIGFNIGDINVYICNPHHACMITCMRDEYDIYRYCFDKYLLKFDTIEYFDVYGFNSINDNTIVFEKNFESKNKDLLPQNIYIHKGDKKESLDSDDFNFDYEKSQFFKIDGKYNKQCNDINDISKYIDNYDTDMMSINRLHSSHCKC